jgi:DNA polymerase III delta prime subunit
MIQLAVHVTQSRMDIPSPVGIFPLIVELLLSRFNLQSRNSEPLESACQITTLRLKARNILKVEINLDLNCSTIRF